MIVSLCSLAGLHACGSYRVKIKKLQLPKLSNCNRVDHGVPLMYNSPRNLSKVPCTVLKASISNSQCDAAIICPVSTADICPVLTEDISPVSTKDATAAGLRPAAVMSSVPESSG